MAPMPWPRLDLPWGVTDAFEELDSMLIGLKEPIITIVGKNERLAHKKKKV